MVLHVYEWGDPRGEPLVCLHGVTGYAGVYQRLSVGGWGGGGVVGVRVPAACGGALVRASCAGVRSPRARALGMGTALVLRDSRGGPHRDGDGARTFDS